VEADATMTRALDPKVTNAIWTAIEPLLPRHQDSHPLGCHRPRISDRLVFRALMIRLVTGSSRVDIETILNFEVSDTTIRRRRNEWINAGVFDQLETEALAGYDRILEIRSRHRRYRRITSQSTLRG
jgi:transposase